MVQGVVRFVKMLPAAGLSMLRRKSTDTSPRQADSGWWWFSGVAWNDGVGGGCAFGDDDDCDCARCWQSGRPDLGSCCDCDSPTCDVVCAATSLPSTTDSRPRVLPRTPPDCDR